MCVTATEGRPLDETTARALEEEIRRVRPELSRCRKCRRLYDPTEESAILRKHTCFTCEWNWLEPRIERLADRIGRKAALMAIRRVTR